MKDRFIGDVYIGGLETDSLRETASALVAVREKHPGVSLRYRSGDTSDLESRLDRGLIDFATFVAHTMPDKYETLELPRRDEWVAYLHRDNPPARKKKLTYADLSAEPLVMSDQVLTKRMAGNPIAEWFDGAYADLDVVATFNLPYASSILVQEGLGTMLTFDNLILCTKDNGLITRPLDPPLYSTLALAWRKGSPLSPAATAFLEELNRLLGEGSI